VEIVVGLWNFNGDITKAARRIGMVGARPFTRLAQVVNVIGVSRSRQRSVPGPGEKDRMSGVGFLTLAFSTLASRIKRPGMFWTAGSRRGE